MMQGFDSPPRLQITMSLLENFPHRCTIRRKTRVSDGYIGSKDHPAEVLHTNVVCWEQQASASEKKEYDKRGILISRKFYFLQDYGITEQDEILITERIGTAVVNPVPLDVKSRTDPDASAGLGLVFKVMADMQTGRLQ